MVPFVSQQLNNLDLALAMARRGNLPGAEGLVAQQFERMFAAGQYKEAAEVAADSPQGILRTKEVCTPRSRQPAARQSHNSSCCFQAMPPQPHAVAAAAAKPCMHQLQPTDSLQPLSRRQVVERLKTVPPTPGQKPPILVYLGVLLQKGKLNALESAELAR